jgi:hypothetical protein
MVTLTEAAAGAVVRPAWRRLRFWLGLGVVLLLGALVVAALSPAPGRDLDPGSAAKGGSKALARVLHGFGVQVQRTVTLADAAAADATSAVLVVAPDDYSAGQLRALLTRPGRIVLLDPSPRALDAAPTLRVDGTADGSERPGCSAPGAVAAGRIDLPAPVTSYRSTDRQAARCYGGAVVLDGRLAVLGSSDLLRNDVLARRGIAALDVNVLTADRSLERLVWLMPGTDAAGPGAPSVWDLFPSGAHRAFVWLIVVGAVVVLWQARRLGPAVLEPLPVVVRAAEAVEGHGRLYRRAGARARAATALRAGSARRLARQVGLPASATLTEIVTAVAGQGRDPAEVRALLGGPPPREDGELVELARGLQQLEAAAGVPPEEKGNA